MGNTLPAYTFLVVTTLLLLSVFPSDSTLLQARALTDIENEYRTYLEKLEPLYSRECNTQMTRRWAYITNVTGETEKASSAALTEYQLFQASVQREILKNFTNWRAEIRDEKLKRQFKYLSTLGPGEMDKAKVDRMNELVFQMESSYAGATVKKYECKNESACDMLSLEPDLVQKLKVAKDYDELAYYWTAWHDALSVAVPTSKYAEFIALQNEMAASNGYKDMGELWASPYDDGSSDFSAKKFENEMYKIWETLRPSYNKLHAYVRMKLRRNPVLESQISKFGHLPANLMGNMWAQDWTALDASTKPYPNEESLDATDAMKKAGYDAKRIFKVSDKFFQDLGLLAMTPTFWEKSLITKPTGRDVLCHASAEDFCMGSGSEDFRIKMCTEVNQDDLVTVHHEMGHIQYFMQYRDQDFIFRDGANPGFHEAIGDALALAVTTPYHLKCVLGLELGLSQSFCQRNTSSGGVTPTDINFLYRMALEKFSFFPFAISMDSWRWGVFNGSITEKDYNAKWWEIRQNNQGVAPPTSRAGSGGLDAAAKYHIVGNVEYIRYFISHILQFQFYEAMCIAAGEFDPEDSNSKPLYQCDFNGNKAAGKKFEDMMKLGFSEPWPVALEKITGKREMSTSSLINYFQPLFDLIDKDLEANGEVIGFGEDIAREYVKEYEVTATKYCRDASVAEFEYETDLLNEEKEEAATNASIAYSQFELQEYERIIKDLDFEHFTDDKLKRQIKFMSAIGTSALNDEDLTEYNQVLSEMSKIYGTAKVCPWRNQACDLETEGLALEPGLTEKMSKIEDYDELTYLWKAWRDATGLQMRDSYLRYVELNNKAAEANGYDNMGDFWLLRYEVETDAFRQDLDDVWNEVNEKLYKPLYAYVRYKLSEKFPGRIENSDKPLPAHVFGNMWAQTWEYLLPLVKPHQDAASFDITEALKTIVSRYEDPLDQRIALFDFARTYFKDGLGLADMHDDYRAPAMIMKPEDREVICHASAWDMCDGEDFRIKMCTEINHNDFITIHHEMGHIQYYHQYKGEPITFRTGANPGFHEAIGDVIALSVSTPAHLYRSGLINEEVTDKSLLNYQMQMALEKVAFLPFGYLMDVYRWQIFDGTYTKENLSRGWLEMRAKYQGIVPPIKRTEKDFDPGAKYHIPASTPYVRYFVSFILQFQLHAALCGVAGNTEPLYNCDISLTKSGHPAGPVLQKLLQAGASKNWQDILEEVTGSRKLDASAIVDYFGPLTAFLNEQQAMHGYSMEVNYGDIGDYISDEPEVLPTPGPEPTTVPVDPTGTGPADPTGTGPADDATTTESSEGDKTSTTDNSQDDDDDGGNDTAAIIVGIILGVAVVVIVVGYFFGKTIRAKCGKSSSD